MSARVMVKSGNPKQAVIDLYELAKEHGFFTNNAC
jgi:hypothetical protein